jgi:hypothetical protein
MNDKEKWLSERIKEKPTLDKNELWCIELLASNSAHENDVSGAIDTLEVLLSLDALPSLLNLMEDAKHSRVLRKRAAKAISVIGSDYIETQLRVLLASSSELRSLAEIALAIKPTGTHG